MIICKSNKIKYFNKNNLKKFNNDIQSLMPTMDDIKNCKCPKCHAKSNFSIHGHYNRNLVIISKEDNTCHEYYLSVTRAICNSCGSTHALLPDFIVPYKTFSFNSIIYIIAEVASSSAYQVANKFNFSFQFVYSIIALLVLFFPQISLLKRQTNFHKQNTNFDVQYFSLNCINICDDDFLQLFFIYYHWAFLMTKFRNIPAPPINIGANFP